MEKSGRQPNLEDQNNRQILVKLEPAVEIEVSFLKFKIVETQYKTCLPKNCFSLLRRFKLLLFLNICIVGKFQKDTRRSSNVNI